MKCIFSRFRNRKPGPGGVAGIWAGVTLLLMMATQAQGYVMPAEQILEFMAKNFSGFKTVVMEQDVRWGSEENRSLQPLRREKVWMKSPDQWHTETLEGSDTDGEGLDHQYRLLMLALTKERLMRVLSEMGIDLERVALTRIEGTVVYRIGDADPRSPKILIEKERFLPVLLVYGTRGGGEEDRISVGFKDYRKLEMGWYPFEIDYSLGTTFQQVFSVTTNSLKIGSPL